MMDPNQPIAVTLPAGQWNTVLALLAEAPAPWKLTDPLMRAIQQQCMAQDPDELAKDQNVQSNVVPIAGE